jgi:large subunit ribosomal protein L15
MRRVLLQSPKKRGFRSLKPKPAVVNLDDCNRVFAAGATVSPDTLIAAGLIRSARDGVKVLGSGAVEKALTLKGLMVSAPAKAKVEAAGGSVQD